MCGGQNIACVTMNSPRRHPICAFSKCARVGVDVGLNFSKTLLTSRWMDIKTTIYEWFVFLGMYMNKLGRRVFHIAMA